MNGNGFKLGSKITTQSPIVKRTAQWSVAFNHKNKGFDNNNSQKCTGYFTNCVSFNNNINYELPYTFEKQENNWSWGAKSKEQKNMNQTIQKPNNINKAQNSFYSIRDQIIKAVYANNFPDKINFDNAIKNLGDNSDNDCDSNSDSNNKNNIIKINILKYILLFLFGIF